MCLELIHQYAALPLPRLLLRELVMRMYHQEQIPRTQATSIVFCSDHVIRRLNRNYRDQDRPTDVLSFRFNDKDLLGELYVSLQRAKVQSRRFGLTYNQELCRLVVHGFFHLLGYDHQTPSLEQKMLEREQVYLPRIYVEPGVPGQ